MPCQETLMHVVKVHQLLERVKRSYRSKRQKRGTGILVFFDFKSAFDKVDHEVLL